MPLAQNVFKLYIYFGLSRQGFNKNHYLKLQKLFTSFRDGVANPEDIFPKLQQEKTRLVKKEEEPQPQEENKNYEGEI